MNKPQTVVIFGIFLCILITLSHTSAAPYSPDYDSVRDLYELLMEKQLLADAYVQPSHRLVRKSKQPSLRLRFGRRSDPSMYQVNSNEEQFQSLPEVSEN
ncbi:short neuropeptide F-like [Planococcus citri]|uniref:short neuropeptide F-like n=1 Tax=Planococcus citri TaxID=170843 RepID=UPI0031F76C76